IFKVYEALVCGTPTPHEGEISAPIGLLEDSIIKRCVTSSGAPSVTRYKVLKKGEKSLVEVVPVTGRTHQIRVHMAHIGCPLYADFLYGEEIKGEHFYLHCKELKFVHPVTDKEMYISCKKPF
ncbi:MAG: RluA family pseudouridine synthase, partial [Clostridia bacterium]|nr:RluA family pseudouridine synthase [Clostridia bacterium]